MRWMLLKAGLCLLLIANLAHKNADAVFAHHHCGSPPFNSNMSLGPPAALSDPVFQDPWVRSHVAVTYDPFSTKDGVGSQLHRQLGVYAAAACAGLQYRPTKGFQRFAHLNGSNAHLLSHRINTMLGIPSTHAHQQSHSACKVVNFHRDCNITWDTLLEHTKAALAAQQPTMFNISFVYGFVLTYPAMLDCVPEFRQQPPLCGPPLLRPLRLAVHIRAGDAEGDPNRLLPHAYFFNIVRTVTKMLRQMQRDYVVEVYTQAAFGIRHHSNGTYHRISGQEYVQNLHQHIGRHLVLLADQDLAWTVSQMSTADIFVHSRSTLSIAAGILNTQGIHIAPPNGSLPWPWLQARHWLHPNNASGRFDTAGHEALVSSITDRFGSACRGRLFDRITPGNQQLVHSRAHKQ